MTLDSTAPLISKSTTEPAAISSAFSETVCPVITCRAKLIGASDGDSAVVCFAPDVVCDPFNCAGRAVITVGALAVQPELRLQIATDKLAAVE